MKCLIYPPSCASTTGFISRWDPTLHIEFEKIRSDIKAESLDEAKEKLCQHIDHLIQKLQTTREAVTKIKQGDLI